MNESTSTATTNIMRDLCLCASNLHDGQSKIDHIEQMIYNSNGRMSSVTDELKKAQDQVIGIQTIVCRSILQYKESLCGISKQSNAKFSLVADKMSKIISLFYKGIEITVVLVALQAILTIYMTGFLN